MKNKNSAGIVVLILIAIALYGAFAMSKPQHVKMVDYGNEEHVLPYQDMNTKPDIKNDGPKPTPKQTYNLSFLKSQIQQFPDSTVLQCSSEGKTYFHLAIDKVTPEGGHITGGGLQVYSADGKDVQSCPLNPMGQTDFCRDHYSMSDSCKVVYQSDKSYGSEKNIDIYHILK